MTTRSPSIGLLLTPPEMVALDAAARAGIRKVPLTASVKTELRGLLDRVREAERPARASSQ